MTDRERFERGSKQDAAMDVSTQIDVVGQQKIVHYSQQNFVHLSRRREKANLLNALNCVLFRLALPHALSYDRSSVGNRIALVFHRLGRIHQDLRELLVLAQPSHVITPKPGLRFEVKSFGKPSLKV